MNIHELRQLAVWYVEHYSQIQSLYRQLIQPIQHNASQPNRQPLETELESLIGYLRAKQFQELSLQQISLLDNLKASTFIGAQGANFIEQNIRITNYDPQNALSKLNEAASTLSSANEQFIAYQ